MPDRQDRSATLQSYTATARNTMFAIIGPSVDDQAVSLSDDGTTIIIDFSLSLLFLFSLFSFFLPPFNSSHSPLAF